MNRRWIIWLSLWLGLVATTLAHAELAAPLTQEIAKLSGANVAQRQALTNEIGSALRLGVGEQDVSMLVKLATTRNYAASDVAQFVQKLAALQRSELPTALVRDKILEGMAKRVPTPAILQVTANWSAALAEAKTTLRGMEQKGLSATPAEQVALINMGAALQQRYGARQALPSLAQSALESGRIKPSAASLTAAVELTETLLLNGAKPEQALSLPDASLRAGYNPQRIQGLQRSVLDQLRQGIAITDIIAAQQKQFGAPQNPAHPPFGVPGQTPGGFQNGAPGGGFQGGAPGGGTPGSGISGGGNFGGAPGSGFPGAPGGNMGGNFSGH